MYGDIDDALALAVLHALADRAEVRIAAVTLSTGGHWPAAYVDLVNRFYGRGDIPVGVVGGGVTEQATIDAFTAHGWQAWLPSPAGVNYTQHVVQLADGPPPFARRAGGAPEEAVHLLRRVLAGAEDNSVVIILTGFSTNLAHLLDSAPDDQSPLDGRALASRKVRLLVTMAGNFAAAAKGQPEFNLLMDVASARKLFDEWPTPIISSGYEIGSAVLFRQVVAERGFGHAGHPVGEALAFVTPHYRQASGHPERPHDHATFDVTAVLQAARPDDGYFTLSAPGRIMVQADGGSRFEPDAHGRHRHLILAPAGRDRLQEAISLLVTQPAAASATAGNSL